MVGGSRGDPWRIALPRVVDPLEHEEHDSVVCVILKWARDTRRDVVAIGELCDALGLDLGDALRRATAHRETDDLASST